MSTSEQWFSAHSPPPTVILRSDSPPLSGGEGSRTGDLLEISWVSQTAQAIGPRTALPHRCQGFQPLGYCTGVEKLYIQQRLQGSVLPVLSTQRMLQALSLRLPGSSPLTYKVWRHDARPSDVSKVAIPSASSGESPPLCCSKSHPQEYRPSHLWRAAQMGEFQCSPRWKIPEFILPWEMFCSLDLLQIQTQTFTKIATP